MKRTFTRTFLIEFVGYPNGYNVGSWHYGLPHDIAILLVPLLRARRDRAAWLWIENR